MGEQTRKINFILTILSSNVLRDGKRKLKTEAFKFIFASSNMQN